jgi:AraC-like DNA-binding protein
MHESDGEERVGEQRQRVEAVVDDAERVFRSPSDRLARVAQAVSAGRHGSAIDELLRLGQNPELTAETTIQCALLLATSYGQLGHFGDATEWLATAQRRIRALNADDNQPAFDACHAALLHWSGDEVNAIRAANAALLRHSKRATDTFRRNLLQTLSGAYLRLGQIVRAEQCAMAAIDGATRGTDRSEGLILLGDIKLWAIVRQHPAFKGQVLVVDDIAARPPPHEALVAAALAAYRQAESAPRTTPLLKRLALAGVAKAQLAGRSSSGDWSHLEHHVIWANQEGLMYERDLTRLHLGVLLLLHQRALDARRWLIPLAEGVMRAQRAPFEHDALFFASVACGESGNHQSALQYLNRYNAGIREQHLSRITVPPPNLETAGPAFTGPHMSRRRGDSDREMVAYILKLLRDAPQARFDSERMAQLAGVSRRTLENGFRRVTGLPPKEYMTRLRLAEFRRRKLALAPKGNAALELLAKSVGFPSYRALARCERRIGTMDIGVPPLGGPVFD